MRGAVLHGPHDVRIELRDDPTIVEPTDAIIRLSATCVCGSDLWPYRGTDDYGPAAPMGHEYVGIVGGRSDLHALSLHAAEHDLGVDEILRAAEGDHSNFHEGDELT